jgi:hypothetical protein
MHLCIPRVHACLFVNVCMVRPYVCVYASNTTRQDRLLCVHMYYENVCMCIGSERNITYEASGATVFTHKHVPRIHGRRDSRGTHTTLTMKCSNNLAHVHFTHKPHDHNSDSCSSILLAASRRSTSLIKGHMHVRVGSNIHGVRISRTTTYGLRLALSGIR